MPVPTKDIVEPLFKFAVRTPLNIAPERGKQLEEEIFGSGKWELKPSATPANFYAVPADKAIYLSYAGLASLWCVAYAAFYVADAASRAQRAPRAPDQTQIDIGKECADHNVVGHIAYALALFRNDEPWPDDLAKPDPSASLASIDGRINNLFYGALSWMLLHEIAHVHHQDIKFLPASLLVKQEYRADDFATRWVLEDAGNGLQREFRILVVVVALTWLFLQEIAKGKGADHPPSILRFREAAQIFQAGNRSVGLENAAYVLKALLDPATAAPPFNSAKELFEWIGLRLEALFPP
ncbi:hypothetical protein M2175_001327 [Bradyrhizobium elkanii]|uniref:phage exclusion protein Lit family protein n=1 Tax=Bradyrhizobium TaxID=374 RepID=UPI00216A8E77|nr:MULTISPECIES: phage exclusion protein Lit family protein [Bradyrhizobium]MCS3926296.1 hypothetical protein [Bradyrhizobium elkanii]MCS3966847.1 hypothetical protein [Bradyrhizobium japonicum]